MYQLHCSNTDLCAVPGLPVLILPLMNQVSIVGKVIIIYCKAFTCDLLGVKVRISDGHGRDDEVHDAAWDLVKQLEAGNHHI